MSDGHGRPEELGAAEIRRRAIEEEPRHRRLVQSAVDGQRLSALMLPTYRLIALPGHGVLTTTGRKSGRPRQKVVRAIRRGDTVFLVMLRPPSLAIERPKVISAWIWNIRSDPRVTLRLGRRTIVGTAGEIEDPTEMAKAKQAFCETVHSVDYGECVLHLRGLPSPTKIRQLHRYWFETGIPVAVDLDPAS